VLATTCPPYPSPLVDWVAEPKSVATLVFGETVVALGAGVGTAMIGHDGHRGWVYYLAVQPSHQRQGVARALMSVCAEWARERGVLKIQLMVRHSNQDVIAFYNALGYVDGKVVVLGRFLDR
jgi:ribosomal protein S18 acetylase RimI-like enzyme